MCPVIINKIWNKKFDINLPISTLALQTALPAAFSATQEIVPMCASPTSGIVRTCRSPLTDTRKSFPWTGRSLNNHWICNEEILLIKFAVIENETQWVRATKIIPIFTTFDQETRVYLCDKTTAACIASKIPPYASRRDCNRGFSHEVYCSCLNITRRARNYSYPVLTGRPTFHLRVCLRDSREF